MGNFAIPLPVSSHIVTPELFRTQNLIWITIVWYLAKVWAKLCLLNLKFYFHSIDRVKSCNIGFSPLWNTHHEILYLMVVFVVQMDKQVLCITLILGLTSEEDKMVRSSALRTIGVFVLFPCLREVSLTYVDLQTWRLIDTLKLKIDFIFFN
jgi:hypothetical protein